ncbi:hypothetical protein [Methylobacterium sp. PvR107]|uniref:hypothetical protein n=1 Tax=Methylobacterium sp. PvR107 TaxID=2806597 RepID=UPI001AE4E488|nr:hypothetical protein [Methylobacterium sp. PvR107]MBP1180034.1 hypothetical protein [Methylobacterium sp. PvR107]
MTLLDRIGLTLWLFIAGMSLLTDHPTHAGFCLLGAAFMAFPDEIGRALFGKGRRE